MAVLWHQVVVTRVANPSHPPKPTQETLPTGPRPRPTRQRQQGPKGPSKARPKHGPQRGPAASEAQKEKGDGTERRGRRKWRGGVCSAHNKARQPFIPRNSQLVRGAAEVLSPRGSNACFSKPLRAMLGQVRARHTVVRHLHLFHQAPLGHAWAGEGTTCGRETPAPVSPNPFRLSLGR